MATEPVTIEATTTGELAGVRVGCGNLWERTFELPDGSETEVLSARLAFGDIALDVYVGSRFRVNNETFRVASIDEDAGRRGAVTIESV